MNSPPRDNQKITDKDRSGNVPTAAADQPGAFPAVNPNEEEGSSVQRPGSAPQHRDAPTDESGALLKK